MQPIVGEKSAELLDWGVGMVTKGWGGGFANVRTRFQISKYLYECWAGVVAF